MVVKLEPVVSIVAGPALLPKFDDSWKDKCRLCKHVFLEVQKDGNEILRCAAVRTKNGKDRALWVKRGIDRMYCIDARDGDCGPDATLWEQK